MEQRKSRSADVGQLIVAVVMCLTTIYYAVETKRLRVAADEQLSRSYRPYLILLFSGSVTNVREVATVKGYLRNIGTGPAFNIYLTISENGVRISESDRIEITAGLGRDAEMELSRQAVEKMVVDAWTARDRVTKGNVLVEFTDSANVRRTTTQRVVFDIHPGGVPKAFIVNPNEER